MLPIIGCLAIKVRLYKQRFACDDAIQQIYGEKNTSEISRYGALASKWFQQAKTRVLRRSKSRDIEAVAPGTAPVADNLE
ncbi:hypothetical protein LSTR_LSTR000306 [Laodelphax striatellus]|uniref:Uncharacterized protein n=1 Tax=Laodelphax striatellus TaxID=195883 RepID=A0A482X7D4_LAOST|nr:hypothetical protein LSTR_LSTR000306 [Laodelphax striatellus]